MALSIDDIIQLFQVRGTQMYGREPVSQTAHALQCADLAQTAGAEPELVAACLLHDLGHLLAVRHDGELAEPGADVDDVHQFFALPFLRGVFPDSVLEPIRLHVDAKRYLCRADSGYWDRLTSASQHSLELQGGVYTTAEAAVFIRLPHAYEAVLLRRWDDLAKQQGKATPDFTHFGAVLEACAH